MSDKKKYYELWEKVKDTVTPIHENQAKFDILIEKIDAKITPNIQKKLSEKNISKNYITPMDIEKFEFNNKKTTQIFDKNIYSKIVKEKIKIQSKIDLHGLNQTEARMRVKKFIENSYNQNFKVSLIITGKGKGILKNSLSNWLNEDDISHMILFHKIAADKHGGSGAFYVYYKKLH